MTAAALGTEVMVATLEADLEDSTPGPERCGLRCRRDAVRHPDPDRRQGRSALAGKRARAAG